MRAGFIASAVGHLTVLVWGLVALPDAEHFEVANIEALPVDLVPIEDITRLRKGERDAEQREIATPAPTEVPAEKPAETEKPAPEPVREVTAAPVPPAAPEPEPEPAPVSEPEPPKPVEPEPVSEPEPAPEPVVEPPKPVKVTPRTKPTPPIKVADAPKKKFDPNNISALLNKVEPQGGPAEASTETASLGSRHSNDSGRLTSSDLALLVSKIKQRFSYYGDDYPDDLRITIQFSLSQDGRVVGRPQVINTNPHPKFDALSRAAVRAVNRVDQEETFAFLPSEKFGGDGGWSTLVVNFYPKQSQ